MSEVRAFCDGTLSASEIVKNARDTRIFLNALLENIDNINISNYTKFISDFNNFVCSKELYNASKEPREWYGVNIYHKCFLVIKKILINEKLKLEECLKLISNNPKFFILNSCILDDMINLDGSKKQDIKISDEDFNSYKNNWIDCLENFVKNRSILDYGNINYIMWTYWRISNQSPNRINFTPLLTTDSDLDKFIEAFVTFGVSSVNGEFVKPEPILIAYIIGKDILNARVTIRLEAGCQETRLKAIYLSVRDNAEYFTVDCTLNN